MTNLSYQSALIIDLCTVLLCALIALRCASSLLHPSAVMLAAHGYIVTLRLSQLARGFKPMSYTFAWPLSDSEIVRGSIASDAALIAMALGWLTVHYWGRHRQQQQTPVEPRIRLSGQRLRLFAWAALILSLGLMAILGPPVQPASALSSSGYVSALEDGAGWCFCLLIYMYGFRLPLVGMTVVGLAIIMSLSAYRGVVIIPCVFLLFTWLVRRNSATIPWVIFPAVVCIWLIWLPMKPISQALRSGESPGNAIAAGVNEAFTNFGQDNGSGIDFQFLDMVSSTMTLVDVHQSHFYGATIEPLLVGPVPRQLWPGKPEMNQFQRDIDVPSRAMAKLNMTAGLIGESYADFGYFGVILIPFFISVAFASAYKRLLGTSVLTPGCLLYLIYLSTYMQLYRDGLIDAVWFPFVHCAPVGWLAVSHWIWPPRDQRAPARSHAPLLPVPTGPFSSLTAAIRR